MGLREQAGGSVWFGQAAISPPKVGRAGCAGVCSSSLSPELPWELWPGWFLQRAAQDSLNEGKSTPLIQGRVPRQSGERWIPPAGHSEALLGTEHSPSTGLLRAPGSYTRSYSPGLCCSGACWRRCCSVHWTQELEPLHSQDRKFGNLCGLDSLASVAFGALNPHCFSSSCGHDPLLLLDVLWKTITGKPFHHCSSTASSHTPAFPADCSGRAATGPFSV